MAVKWSPEQHVLTSGHRSLGHKHPVCVRASAGAVLSTLQLCDQ